MRSYSLPRGHRWDALREPKSEPLSREEMEVDRTFAVAFSTPEGKRALEFMHRLTTWRRNRSGDSDGALRELEAQRMFVAIIEARIERHGEKAAKPKESNDAGSGEGRTGRRRRGG